MQRNSTVYQRLFGERMIPLEVLRHVDDYQLAIKVNEQMNALALDIEHDSGGEIENCIFEQYQSYLPEDAEQVILKMTLQERYRYLLSVVYKN